MTYFWYRHCNHLGKNPPSKALVMHHIYLCIERRRPELEQWLQSMYEVVYGLPKEPFSLLITDTDSLERIAQKVKHLKSSEQHLFMPVILLSTKEIFSKWKENDRLQEVLDEVIFEPVTLSELKMRMAVLLQAHDFSIKARQNSEYEIKLELQAHRLANLSENVPGMLYQFAVLSDGSTHFEYISEGCRQIFEIEPEEAVKNPMVIIKTVHPDDAEDFKKTLDSAIRQYKTFIWEGRYIIKDKIKWIKAASSPHSAPYGLVWDGVMVDITRLKNTENALRDLALFNELIIENSQEGIFVCDPHMQITKWNYSMEKISGISGNEVIGRNASELFPFISGKMIVQLEQALQGVPGETNDYQYTSMGSEKNGWAKNRYIPLRNANGALIGTLCTVDEITFRKQTEVELKSLVSTLQKKNGELITANAALDMANAKLKKIDEAKSHFVTMASHEIRTPLTSILGFVQTLRSTEISLSERLKADYLAIIENEAKRLSNLVETLLSISRLEAGRQELQRSSFLIGDLVRMMADTFKNDKNLNISFNVIENYSGQVFADCQQIGLVIRNILSNAVRYTASGGTIDVEISKEDHFVQVAITDHGPGIPQDQLRIIFEKFYRIQENHTTVSTGSGLGLSIAQEIIRAHGGNIWAESTDIGSTFYFTLPDIGQ